MMMQIRAKQLPPHKPRRMDNSDGGRLENNENSEGEEGGNEVYIHTNNRQEDVEQPGKNGKGPIYVECDTYQAS